MKRILKIDSVIKLIGVVGLLLSMNVAIAEVDLCVDRLKHNQQNSPDRGLGDYPLSFFIPNVESFFRVDQKDSRLPFRTLCGPSAVTESLQYLKWHLGYSNLKWFGDIESYPAKSDLIYKQVEDLADLFKFGSRNDLPFKYTHPVDLVIGLREYLRISNYPNAKVYMKGMDAFDAPPGSSLDIARGPVTEFDIAKALHEGYEVVILNRDWRFSEEKKKFERVGGHYLRVRGYQLMTARSGDIIFPGGALDLYVNDSDALLDHLVGDPPDPWYEKLARERGLNQHKSYLLIDVELSKVQLPVPMPNFNWIERLYDQGRSVTNLEAMIYFKLD